MTLKRVSEDIAPLMPEIMFRLRQYAEPLPSTLASLTLPQVKTLFCLSYVMKTPPTVSALAKHVGVTPPTMTHGVDRLERAGFVARRRHAEDRRIVRVVMTPRGQALLRTIKEHHERAILALLKRMPQGDRSILQRHLHALVSVLRRFR